MPRPSLFLFALLLLLGVGLAAPPTRAQVSLDPSFGAGGRRTVPFDLDGAATDRLRRVFPSAGGLLLVGEASSGSELALAIARLDADGQLDPAFGSNGKRTYAVGIQAVTDATQDGQGRVVFGGTTRTGGDVLLGRLLPDGNVDPGFGFLGLARLDLEAEDELIGLASGPQSQVLALLRSRANASLAWGLYVVALDASGGNQRSLLMGGLPAAGSAALAWSAPRGELLVGFSVSGSQTCNLGLHAVTLGAQAQAPLGSSFLGGVALSNTANGCGQARITAVAALPGGAGLIVGHRENPAAPGSGRQHGLLVKVAASGGLDASFNGSGLRIEAPQFPADDLRFQAAAVDAQGRLLIGADNLQSGGPTNAFLLRRHLPNGSPDSGFNAGSAQIGTSFPASGGSDSPLAYLRDLRLAGPRIALGGYRRWSGGSDDDFAVAAYTLPDAPLFGNGFEP